MMDTRLPLYRSSDLDDKGLDELMELEGVIPLSDACSKLRVDEKRVRNALRYVDPIEISAHGIFLFKPEGRKTKKVVVFLRKAASKLRDLGKPKRNRAGHHDQRNLDDRPEGWYPKGKVLEKYPLLHYKLEALREKGLLKSDKILLPQAFDA